MKPAAGFTMIELMMVMVMIGVLAAVAMPRMTSSDFRALQFHDQTVATLRFAQKTATSHRRLVCVAFTASSVSLTIDHDKNGSCDGHALMVPGSSTNVVTSSDVTNVVFSPVPASLSFQPNGTSADASLKIAGMSDIVVVGATGHVE
jgi:MSHA pilin protein MshC